MAAEKIPKPIVVLHPSVGTEAKRLLAKAGYLAIYAENPAHVQVVLAGSPLLNGDAILVAAAKAIQPLASSSVGNYFARNLCEAIIAEAKRREEAK